MFAGKSNKVEEPRRSDGWPHNQWRTGDASARFPRRVHTGHVEGDFCLWKCLHSKRDQVRSHPWPTGTLSHYLFNSLCPTADHSKAQFFRNNASPNSE